MTETTISTQEIKDAKEMLGAGYPAIVIEPARIIIERQDGKLREVEHPAWVKFSTAFKRELPNIDETALKVFIFLALSINTKNNRAWPGTRAIADGTGLNKDTVTSAIRRLESLDLLRVYRKTGSKTVFEPLMVSANGEHPTVRTDGTVLSEQDSKLSEQKPELSEQSPVNLHNQINQSKPDKAKISKQNPEWALLHGEGVPGEDYEIMIRRREAVLKFEEAMGVKNWPWSGTRIWEKFENYIVEIYLADQSAFWGYRNYLENGGKYKGMSAKQIRMNPQMFMDTGWPEYVASRKQEESHAPEKNVIPLNERLENWKPRSAS